MHIRRNKENIVGGSLGGHILTIHQLYDFFIVNDGIDRRTSMLRHRTGRRHRPRKEQATRATENNAAAPEADPVSSLTKSMSALEFVPRNLKFGKGASKAFTR